MKHLSLEKHIVTINIVEVWRNSGRNANLDFYADGSTFSLHALYT